MPDIDVVPSSYWWRADIAAATLRHDVTANGGRLTSLGAFVQDGEVRFSAAWIANTGDAHADGDWDDDIGAEALRRKMELESCRIVCLTSYLVQGERHYAAAWVKNTGAHQKTWWWHHDLAPDALGKRLDKQNGVLAAIDAWDVGNNQTRCAAVWIASAGQDAVLNWWHPRVDGDTLAAMLADNVGRIVCADAYRAGEQVFYAAGWIKNDGPHDRAWLWWENQTHKQVEQLLDLNCGYPVEVRSTVNAEGERTLLAVINAEPSPAEPALLGAQLSGVLTRVGSDLPTSPTDTDYDAGPLHQWMDLDLALTNESTAPVTVPMVELYAAESGGFVYADGPEFALQAFFGQPALTIPSLAPGARLHSTGSRDSNGGIEHYVLRWRATQGSKTQNAFAACKVARAGYTPPPALSTSDPVMLATWTNPAEFVPMSVGDRDTTWLTVGGQILNATERELRIANFSIRLTVDGHAVLDQPFVPTFAQFHPNRFDPDKTFDTLAPFEGVVSLPDFATYFVCGFDLPSVPETFEHATLHLVLNYKIGSRCGTAVVKTAVARLKPLVVSSPLQGRWDFGNSPDHRVFDAHAWPGQRFSIDFTKLGDDGKPFKPDQPLNENRTFWAYGRPIHAIAPGTVVSETDANVEGFGMTENDESAINYVLIHHRDSDGPGGNFYHGYYHVRKDKNAVSVGDNVDTGQHIADVGNAAAAEPHLHLGTGRRDATGNGTPIPLVFRDLTSVDGAPVHDVPATAEYVAPS